MSEINRDIQTSWFWNKLFGGGIETITADVATEAYSSIVQHLNNMMNYNHFQSKALTEFKKQISYLLKELKNSAKTKHGIELWYNHLDQQQKILGYPQYAEGDPYGGPGDLVNTPENMMRKYIHYEIMDVYQAYKEIWSHFADDEKTTRSCMSNQYFVQTTCQ